MSHIWVGACVPGNEGGMAELQHALPMGSGKVKGHPTLPPYSSWRTWGGKALWAVKGPFLYDLTLQCPKPTELKAHSKESWPCFGEQFLQAEGLKP